MLDTAANHDDDGTSVLTEVFRAAFWAIAYHEAGLPKAHRLVALTHALLERAGQLMPLAEAQEIANGTDDDDAKDVRHLAAYLLVTAHDGIDHHETELAAAHTKLANAKILMRRAGLDLPLADLQAKATEPLRA